MYTQEGLSQQKNIKTNYPTLWAFYADMMGNFEFTQKELIANIKVVTEFLKNESNFRIIEQEGCFYLTDF